MKSNENLAKTCNVAVYIGAYFTKLIVLQTFPTETACVSVNGSMDDTELVKHYSLISVVIKF